MDFWSRNLSLFAQFPDRCLLLPVSSGLLKIFDNLFYYWLEFVAFESYVLFRIFI